MRHLLAVLLLIISAPVAAAAQWYAWRDSDGALHVTDQFATIPDDVRTRAQVLRYSAQQPSPEYSSPEVSDQSPGASNPPAADAATPFSKGGAGSPPLKKGAANVVSGGFASPQSGNELLGNSTESPKAPAAPAPGDRVGGLRAELARRDARVATRREHLNLLRALPGERSTEQLQLENILENEIAAENAAVAELRRTLEQRRRP